MLTIQFSHKVKTFLSLLVTGGGMGKAFCDSANYGYSLSIVYPPMLAGRPKTERHSKRQKLKEN